MNNLSPISQPTKRRFTRHIPQAQFLLYLVVGGWNTIFGYICFFLLTRWLSRAIPAYSYVVANLAANLVAITVAFLGYKWFIFRTKGNYLREWMRCLVVYSTAILLSTAALPPLVGLIRHTTHYQSQAPYIAGALVGMLTVISSFFGHKHLSFRQATKTV